MSIVYAIPTYKRYNIIADKTLSVLNSYDIPKKDIYIFVANKDEYKLYQEVLGNEYKLIVGVILLSKQRNFIQKYFPIGKKIVFLDDDVSQITELTTTPKSKLKRLPNLKRFVNDAFAECKSVGAFIWGVYPVDNHYFMRKVITHDLRYLIGPFYGIINRHSKDVMLWIEEKEDGLRTLQYFKKDGAVVRYNYVGVKTKFYAQGGMSVGRDRKKESKIAVQKLHKEFPTLTRIQENRKVKDLWEIKLIKNKI